MIMKDSRINLFASKDSDEYIEEENALLLGPIFRELNVLRSTTLAW